MFKRSIVALAAVAGLGLSVGAVAAPVVFNDQAGIFTFTNMVWQTGNALAIGAQSEAATIDTNGDGVADAKLLHTVAQARLSSFTLSSGGARSLTTPAEITYQADFWEIATGIGGTTAGFTLATPPTGSANTITMYYQNNAAFFGDITNGKNYGAEGGATKILEGTLQSLSGNFTDFTLLGAFLPVNPWPVMSLDCDSGACVLPGTPPLTLTGLDGVDQAPGTLTHFGNGNNQISVDVTYQNNAFFLSNVSSLILDMTQNIGVSDPFQQGNPWKNVVNQTPSFTLVGGTRINGAIGCAEGGQTQDGANSNRCDNLLQTTGATTFNATPEPTSLALVGIALVGIGFAARRRNAA